MPRYQDGGRVATTIFEAAAWHYAIKPVCRCGHCATFNPHGLWWYFERRGWSDRLADARKRFWCKVCTVRPDRWSRPVKLDLVREAEADICLEFPPEHVWKRAVNRFRS